MSPMEKEIKGEFIKNSIYRMDESTRMIQICFKELSEEQVWKKPNKSSNSIANLILHLCGNITQYIISSLGEVKDTREREKEFSTTEGYTKDRLLQILLDTVENAKAVIQSTTQDKLLKERDVQGFNFSGIGIVIHVVEHYSYHTGQIAFWSKLMKNIDLGFYDGIDLTIKNKK
jgi:uncharacterized damage-inducible protein DinB